MNSRRLALNTTISLIAALTILTILGFATPSFGDINYHVYGGASFEIYEPNWWEKGYHPESHGYTHLGSSNRSKTFQGNYSFYIITTYEGDTAPLDTVQGSDNTYFSIYAGGNSTNYENIGGSPDNQCAIIGGLSDPPVSGFIVINASSYNLESIKVYLCSVDFPANSDMFTNKYFSKFALGASAELTGYGNESGQWRKYIVSGKTTFNNVKCLILREENSDGDYTIFYLAQDSEGNIRCLRAFGYLEDIGNFDQDFSSAPALVIPQNPYFGQTWPYYDGATVTIESLNDLVPQMSTGQGPFPDCLRMRWQDGTDIDYIYWSPTGLPVKWINNDDGGVGGYELNKIELQSRGKKAIPSIPLLLLGE
jgi:hypothetical protein